MSAMAIALQRIEHERGSGEKREQGIITESADHVAREHRQGPTRYRFEPLHLRSELCGLDQLRERRRTARRPECRDHGRTQDK